MIDKEMTGRRTSEQRMSVRNVRREWKSKVCSRRARRVMRQR